MLTEEQLLLLRRKINTLSNMSYSSGVADESEQQSYKQQNKYSLATAEAADDLYNFVTSCL